MCRGEDLLRSLDPSPAFSIGAKRFVRPRRKGHSLESRGAPHIPIAVNSAVNAERKHSARTGAAVAYLELVEDRLRRQELASWLEDPRSGPIGCSVTARSFLFPRQSAGDRLQRVHRGSSSEASEGKVAGRS